jgi:hypothetical protein
MQNILCLGKQMLVHTVPTVICLQKINVCFKEQIEITVNLASDLSDIIKCWCK